MPPPPVWARTVPPTSLAVMSPPTVSRTADPRTVPTCIFPAPLEQRNPPPTVPTRTSPPPATSFHRAVRRGYHQVVQTRSFHDDRRDHRPTGRSEYYPFALRSYAHVVAL